MEKKTLFWTSLDAGIRERSGYTPWALKSSCIASPSSFWIKPQIALTNFYSTACGRITFSRFCSAPSIIQKEQWWTMSFRVSLLKVLLKKQIQSVSHKIQHVWPIVPNINLFSILYSSDSHSIPMVFNNIEHLFPKINLLWIDLDKLTIKVPDR